MQVKPDVPALAYLTFTTGPLAGITFPITQPVLTLGRAASNDIVIGDTRISRIHARLSMENGTWQIQKLSSAANGLIVHQRSVERATLEHNEWITLGEEVTFHFLLKLDADVAVTEPQQPNELTTRLAKEAPSGGLAQYNGPSAGDFVSQTEVGTPSSMGLSTIDVTDNTTGVVNSYPLVKPVIDIGRDKSNTIVIPEMSVSAFHLQVVYQDQHWKIAHPHPDRQATQNGLFYAGRTIRGDQPFSKVLAQGDTFRIGDEHGSLITLTYNDGHGKQQEFFPRTQTIPLDKAEITLGRLQENDVVLNHPQVSSYHARLVRQQEEYHLIDLNSTNHTYVNGLQISDHLLQYQDEIRIGPFKLMFEQTQLTLHDESGGVRIDVINMRQVSNKQTVLLNDISLSIPPRSFVALVGSSGAGKSTLLDAISGLRPAREGSVFYNGQDYYQNMAAFNTQMGYVPQDEIIHRDLTVERVLYYAARLRLPKDFTQEQINQRIDEVLDDVEMQHRRGVLVRQLSGGQRKRVSIALELLGKPSIFFLDEPTSGLDPGLDRKMMVLLRKLADKGHTIVLVTHATNNINVCDFVCFLAAGGNLAYFGPPDGARSYFQQPDFAEIYSTLEPNDAHPHVPHEASEEYLESKEYKKYINEPLSRRPSSNTQLLRQTQTLGKVARKGTRWRQFKLLTQRYVELLKNDRVNLAILLLQAPIIGLLLMIFILGVGVGAFDRDKSVQCYTTAAILAPAGFPDPVTPADPLFSKSCQRVEDFLQNNPRGQAYARNRGGVSTALQDFTDPGPGYGIIILFIGAFSAIMFGCLNAAREFVKEAAIYKRERAVNLGIFPYMLSKITILGLFCLLQSFIMLGFIAIFDPFHVSILLPPFLELYISVALTSLVGLMIGLTISALVSNTDRAMSFVPVILIPQVIFSGAVFPLTTYPLQILGMLFPVRWAMTALGSSAGLHSDKVNGDQIIGNNYSYHGTLFSIYKPEDSLHYLLLSWLVLIVMFLLLALATAYFLKRKDVRVS